MAKAAKKPVKSAKKATKSANAAKRAKASPRAPATPRTLTPYLAIDGASEAIEWYKRAYGAKEISREPVGDGKLMHAELKIGDSTLYLSDIFPGSDMQDARRAAPSVNIHLYAKNVDKLWNNAVTAGAKVTLPLADQFWGDKYGRLLDPFGHSWAFSFKSKLSKADLEKLRIEAMKTFSGGA